MDQNRNDQGSDDNHTGRDSDGETVQETSFVTATEGLDDNGSITDRTFVTSDEKSASVIPSSSRSMPLPSHLDRSSVTYRSSMNTLPHDDLPSYNDVMTNASEYSTAADVSAAPTVDPIEDDSHLTPEEIAVVLKMRSGKNAYRVGPSSEGESRESYAEAIEMLSPEERDGFHSIEEGPPQPRRLAGGDRLSAIEAGGDRQVTGRNNYKCTALGPLNRPITAFCRMLQRQSQERLVIIGVLSIVFVGLILFVSLFPASFVYVEYHEVALLRSRITNKVDRSKVYYPGCYVLSPDTKLVRFQASAHTVASNIGVFTKDTISIRMGYSLQYFIRPEEVGHLYTKFMHNYDEVFQKIIDSTIKNTAGPQIKLDDFRFNRTSVEKLLHSMVRQRLGGDCCPACCPRNCQSNTYCDSCQKNNCNQGYHVDVRFFSLLAIEIPEEVFSRYLQRTIQEIDREKEYFLQDHSVWTKETEQLMKRIKNEGNEIVSSGNAEAMKIRTIAEADKEVKVQQSYTKAIGDFFQHLNVTSEDHKMSLMMIRSLEDSQDNLYNGYGFDQSTFHMP